MEAINYKALIYELAQALLRAKLAGEHLSYGNSIQVIGSLLMATMDTERTRYIVLAVLIQAVALDKSYAWLESELQFELMATTFAGNRQEAMAYNLKRASIINDQELDLYNDRLNRFPINKGITTQS